MKSRSVLIGLFFVGVLALGLMAFAPSHVIMTTPTPTPLAVGSETVGTLVPINLTPLLTDLVNVLVASLIVLVTVHIWPRVVAIVKPWAEKYPTEYAFTLELVEQGVKAAEKYINGEKQGAAKLRYVLGFVEAQARKYGYSFDSKGVETLINAKLVDLESRPWVGK